MDITGLITRIEHVIPARDLVGELRVAISQPEYIAGQMQKHTDHIFAFIEGQRLGLIPVGMEDGGVATFATIVETH